MALLFAHATVIFELGSFLLKTSFHTLMVAVTVFAVFHRDHVVVMLFRQDFTVLDWLD